MVEIGYATQAAHPWLKADLEAVLRNIDEQLKNAEGWLKSKLLRDAFTMTILWDTCSRGATAVHWKLDHIADVKGALCSCLAWYIAAI